MSGSGRVHLGLRGEFGGVKDGVKFADKSGAKCVI